MSITHKIADLFHTDWQHLKADTAGLVLSMQHSIEQLRLQQRFDALGSEIYRMVLLLARQPKVFKQLSAEQIRDIYHDINLFEKMWYHFHVTWIKTKSGKLYAPEEKLSDFTFLQLQWADSEYSKFLIMAHNESQEAGHYLNRLIAVLYSPMVHGMSPDRPSTKAAFTEDQIEAYANILPPDLTFQLKYLILRTYANCRSFIVNRCEHLFPKPPQDYDAPGTPQYTGQMWADLLYDLADTPAFAGYTVAANTNIYKALNYLDKKAREAKELRERSHKNA